MLLPCNDKNMAVLGLFMTGFLPTMKFQHSSCHRLLVQGASQTDAPFFMFIANDYLVVRNTFKHLGVLVDESHQKFFDHCAH